MQLRLNCLYILCANSLSLGWWGFCLVGFLFCDFVVVLFCLVVFCLVFFVVVLLLFFLPKNLEPHPIGLGGMQSKLVNC